MTNPNWTSEEDDSLRRFIKEGLASGQIATALGRSRNAVVGRAKRLGLVFMTQAGMRRREVKEQRESSAPRVPSRKHQPLGGNRFKSLREKATETEAAPKELPRWTAHSDAPEPRNLSLVDLEWLDCRWPVNNPERGQEHLFCGHKRASGSSYCAHHRLVSAGRHLVAEAA